MDLVHAAVGLYSPLRPPAPPRPDAIIQESATHYTVAHQTDHMGILFAPHTVAKEIFTAAYPETVAAWKANFDDETQEALQNERNLTSYATYFRSVCHPPQLKRLDRGVACAQGLLPGMTRHWGLTRQCETHSRELGVFVVCKGCRVAHYTQCDGGFNRGLIMARGARVCVCEGCAEKVVGGFGAGYKGCVCDAKWTCCRCRENELARLARARKRLESEVVCEMCGEKAGERAENVEFCLLCREVRVYSSTD